MRDGALCFRSELSAKFKTISLHAWCSIHEVDAKCALRSSRQRFCFLSLLTVLQKTTKQVRVVFLVSENNFAICFPLEIPLRGLPFQIHFYDKCRITQNNTNLVFQRISFEKEIPSWGSRAGETHRKSILSYRPAEPTYVYISLSLYIYVYLLYIHIYTIIYIYIY